MYSVRRLAPAATAGISPGDMGDMIVAIDDQDVASVSSLAANVGRKRSGDKSVLRLVRTGRPLNIEVTFG